MIDDEKEVHELIEALNEHLPMPADASSMVSSTTSSNRPSGFQAANFPGSAACADAFSLAWQLLWRRSRL